MSKFGYGGAICFLSSHCLFAQPQPKPEPAPPLAANGVVAPTASPVFSLSPTPTPPQKLEVDTVAAIPLEQRRVFLTKLSATERMKFAERVRDLPPSGQANAKINALFMGWSGIDPAAAMENAKKFPTQRTRRVAIEAIVYGMELKSAALMVQALRALAPDIIDSETKEQLLGLSIVKLSQTDPAAAAHAVVEIYPEATSRLAKPGLGDGVLVTTVKGVAMNWGDIDPPAALAWYQKKGEPENLFAVKNVIFGWWKKDRAAAAAYVNAHLSTASEREIAGLMSGAMAEQDPRVASEWVKWNKDNKTRLQLQSQIANIWAAKDPKAAAKWAATLPVEEGKGIIAIIASWWAQNDSRAAAKWLDSFKGPLRDAAIFGFASATVTQDYPSALEWAMKISDPSSRERLTKAIVNQWMRLKPNEARPWIQNSKMPEAQKKHLLGLD